MRRFRLTLSFVVTALLVMTGATIGVNLLAGRLAEQNLLRVTEENTARDAAHIQSMMLGSHRMPGMGSAPTPTTEDGMPRTQPPVPLSLDSLAGPEGLSRTFRGLVEGLHVVKLNIFDLTGKTVWSTDPGTVGVPKRENELFNAATSGATSSKLARGRDLTDLEGVRRSLDVVETYLPLKDGPEGKQIGVLEIYRDVTSDFAIQVTDTKARVLQLTIATMGGLFIVLAGFVVVADMALFRANRRELVLVEGQLAERNQAERPRFPT